MRNDDELLQLIRTDKRKKVDPVHIELNIFPDNMGADHEVFAEERVDLDVARFTMDQESIVAQIKIATKLGDFIRNLEKLRSNYVKQLAVAYGPLMKEFCNQYSAAYLKKTPDLFEMRQVMAHIRTFAKELALREDKDESIFDARRIERELSNLTEEPDGSND